MPFLLRCFQHQAEAGWGGQRTLKKMGSPSPAPVVTGSQVDLAISKCKATGPVPSSLEKEHWNQIQIHVAAATE